MSHLYHIREIIGLASGVREFAALSLVITAKGVYFLFDHKTILTWLAWVFFGILLAGRRVAGWRARTALNWFWAGFVVFVVAYFGYSFIQELVR